MLEGGKDGKEVDVSPLIIAEAGYTSVALEVAEYVQARHGPWYGTSAVLWLSCREEISSRLSELSPQHK